MCVVTPGAVISSLLSSARADIIVIAVVIGPVFLIAGQTLYFLGDGIKLVNSINDMIPWFDSESPGEQHFDTTPLFES